MSPKPSLTIALYFIYSVLKVALYAVVINLHFGWAVFPLCVSFTHETNLRKEKKEKKRKKEKKKKKKKRHLAFDDSTIKIPSDSADCTHYFSDTPSKHGFVFHFDLSTGLVCGGIPRIE